MILTVNNLTCHGKVSGHESKSSLINWKYLTIWTLLCMYLGCIYIDFKVLRKAAPCDVQLSLEKVSPLIIFCNILTSQFLMQ